MIYINGKPLARAIVSSKPVSVIRYGARVAWQAIGSCFGMGYWRGDRPWIGSDGWKGRP